MKKNLQLRQVNFNSIQLKPYVCLIQHQETLEPFNSTPKPRATLYTAVITSCDSQSALLSRAVSDSNSLTDITVCHGSVTNETVG